GARAREEHRRFRQVLRFVADEVLDVQELLEEVMRDPAARNEVLSELATLLSWPPAVLLALNELPPGRLAAGLVEGGAPTPPSPAPSIRCTCCRRSRTGSSSAIPPRSWATVS